MRYLLYSCIVAFCWVLTACKKDKLMDYQLDPMVYFYKDSRTVAKDSIIYSFATKPESLMTDTIRIPIRIMGEAMNKERKVNYAVISDKTDPSTGNYELLQSTIPAGSFTGEIAVKVTRTADLKTKEYRIWLQIGHSEDFKPGVNNQSTYLVRLNDFLTKPASWADSYFGKYSATKFSLLIQATGYTDFAGVSTNEMRFIAQAGKNAVFEWEAAHNTTMLDEFNEPVTFP